MAPEQLANKPCDHRVDVYSFGVVFFELVTGLRPFRATNLAEIIVQQLPMPPPTPSAVLKETVSGGANVGVTITSETNTIGSGGSGDAGTTSAGGDGGGEGGSGGGGGSPGVTGGGSGGDGGSTSTSMSTSSSSSTSGADCEVDDCCSDNPDKTEPGQCGCDLPDTDTDGDGTADCIDECPDDADKSEPGECGCGVPDEDTVDEAGCLGLAAGILHRYSFDGQGAQVIDSQSGADGELVGTTLSGSGQLVLSSEEEDVEGERHRRLRMTGTTREVRSHK
jgi:hypothetical protein